MSDAELDRFDRYLSGELDVYAEGEAIPPVRAIVAELRQLRAVLTPFAATYAESLTRCPDLASWSDAEHWILRSPKVGAWRSAHVVLNPMKEAKAG